MRDNAKPVAKGTGRLHHFIVGKKWTLRYGSRIKLEPMRTDSIRAFSPPIDKSWFVRISTP